MISNEYRIYPDPPSFGYISIGFIYKLKITLTNTGTEMDRFKIIIQLDDKNDTNIITSDYKIVNLAPGMSNIFNLELRAETCYETTYTMLISKSNSKIIDSKIISALIIPQDSFKKISKSLVLRNQRIYAPGVKCIGQLTGENAGPSIISGAPTIYSENLIDDEELEELMDLPILPETYWNPYTKELCVDSILSRVITSPKWTVEESKEATEKSWEARVDELEIQGMLTSRILERLIKEKMNRSSFVNRSYSSFDQNQISYTSLYSSSLLSPGR